MPLDANGAWVPELAPPTADQLGVAAAPSVPVAPALPLNPLEADRLGLTDPNSPNSRPVVTSPTQEPPPVVPVAAGAPVQPSQVPPPVPAAATPPVAPVIPIRRPPTAGAAQPTGGGIPGELSDIDKKIDTDEEAQKKALQDQADTEALGQARVADEKLKVAGIQTRQAADLAAQQQWVRDRQDYLNQVDRQNLEAARNKTIPDFWANHEGAHVGATIGVVLAGLGAGFLGSTQNQAAEVIQHNVDKYFDRKKEEIDNLFKYAQAQGLVNDKARDQYAKTLTDMLQQHAAVLDAAKTRVEAVAAESQSEDAKARAAVLISQLGAASSKEHLAVNDQRLKWYQDSDASAASRAKIMSARADLIRANADAARVGIEKQKAAAGGGDEKADEAAFRTYVQAPHGKEAQTLQLRLSNLDSAVADIKNGRSEGEVTKALEAAIAADTGQGTRGVSMGQLHSIIPNLVSAEGKVSNAVSQNWNGKAGKEYRAAVLRLAQSALDNREREYKQKGDDLEKSVALTPHGQKNPNFAKIARAQLYPERASSTPAADTGTKTLRMPDGSLATFDASGKRIK